MSQKQAIFGLMGNRVHIMRGRYNPTSDAVWLAAFAPNNAKTVLEVGVGTGGALLCLMYHNPDVTATAIDVSDEMLAECRQNLALNNKTAELISADIYKWRTDRTFDTVISNPPYFTGTPAAHNAHHNADIYKWTRQCIKRVRPRGTFCTIVDAATLHHVIAAMTPTCGDITIMPLFGAKQTAERVLIRGRVGLRGGVTLHRGLSMNNERVLRDGLTITDVLATLDA